MKKFLITTLALASTAGVLSAASISLNFNSFLEDAALLPGESAGAPGRTTTGWNNIDGIPDGNGMTGDTAGVSSPNAGVLTQDDGAVVSTTIAWSASNAWNTNNGVSNSDNKLMNGYIDTSPGTPQVAVGVVGVPYTLYTVVAYVGSDTDGRTGTISITGGDTFSYTASSNQGGGFPGGYAQTTDTGAGNPSANFAVWENQTAADFTLTVTRGSDNTGIHGFQIIQVPEPTLPSLLGLGGFLLLFRRRR